MPDRSFTDSLFRINHPGDFTEKALQVFAYQREHCSVYHDFLQLSGMNKKNVTKWSDIPFLPIEFFKSARVSCTEKTEEIFTSSGTTGDAISRHYVSDLSIYEKSFREGFAHFYGDISDYCVLALLPSYLEREGSSLVYMAHDLVNKSGHPQSGFYRNDYDQLQNILRGLEERGQKTLLLGVSYALLDLAEQFPMELRNTLIMETGGMKGQRKEMTREELHNDLCRAFHVDKIHSEYGMTELLSQGYSKGNGIFHTPPWMKVITRDPNDPFAFSGHNRTGGINVIDLANVNSCSFIATQDLGKTQEDGSFEMLGRFDNSDIRGCNLMAE
jgi:phenylacetate-coenzyme A ligase PaaK-like adenylate-forming protein